MRSNLPRQWEDASSQAPVKDKSEDITACSLKFLWLDSEEAAEFLRLSVKALRNMASNGQVPFYKLGRRNRYRKDELEALLRSQKRGQQWELK